MRLGDIVVSDFLEKAEFFRAERQQRLIRLSTSGSVWGNYAYGQFGYAVWELVSDDLLNALKSYAFTGDAISLDNLVDGEL